MKMKIFGNIIRAVRGVKNCLCGGAMKALVAIAAVALSSTVWAEDWHEWTDGNGYKWCYWSLDGSVIGVRIQKDGPGTQPAISPLPSGVFQIPSTLGDYPYNDPVKEIGTGAFRECVGLTKVKVPSGVTKIGGSAFLDCTSLEEVELPDSVKQISGKAFLGCTSLERVNIPSGVTTIANQTFKGCSSLEQVNIPSGVTFIPSETFEGCSSLETIKIPSSVDTIYNSAFKDCSNLNSVELNEGLTTIKAYAFYGCDSLTEVTIPTSVTSIEPNAFAECDYLETVYLPAALLATINKDSVFANCPDDLEIVAYGTETVGDLTWHFKIVDGGAELCGLPTIPSTTSVPVVIPATLGGLPVVSIGEDAFMDCGQLPSVTIPATVTSIGDGAFSGCDALESIEIPSSVTSIGDRAFFKCKSLTDADIPDSVTSLGYGVFEECKGLKHVTIGRGVSEIPDQMFVNCESLTSVIVPEGVKSIGNWAFWGCKNLESVAILKNVTSIGTAAFDNTDALTTVYVAPGGKNKVKAMLEGSGRDTSGLTFVEVVTVTFNANGGTCATASVLVPVDTAVGTLPDATRDGYVFDGWFTAAEGGEKVSSGTIVNSDATYYAHWAENTAYTWFTKRSDAIAEALKTGKKIFLLCGRDTCYNTMTTKMSCEDPTVKAKLVEKCVLWYSNCDTQKEENWYYWPMGVSVTLPLVCIIDPNNPGGYIKRVTGGDYGGPLSAADVLALIADIPYPSASGTSGYVYLDAKDITEPYSAAKTLYGAVYNGSDVVGVVELRLGKVNARKGTSRISGAVTLLDGKRYTIKSLQATVGAPAPLSVSLVVNKVGTMAITIGGNRFAGSLGSWHVQIANVGGNWKSPTVTVTVEIGDLSAIPGMMQYSLLPAAEKGISSGTRWTFPKATRVKWSKPKFGETPVVQDATSGKGLIVDTSNGTNLSSMRLTYAAKKGTFKGSFKVYSLEESGASTKLKKYTMKVGGVVVDGVGYGTATCKRPAITWSVTVE